MADQVSRFGGRLANLRESAGLSQSALARKIGTSQSAVSRMESGDRNPSLGMLIQLAMALGIKMAVLFGESGETLIADENILLARYRAMTEPARSAVDGYAQYLVSTVRQAEVKHLLRARPSSGESP